MLKRKIRRKLINTISDAEGKAYEAMIDGDIDKIYYSDGSPVYQNGYGESSFHIRLSSKRQVEEIYDFLWNNCDCGYDDDGDSESLENEELLSRGVKAVYELWISFVATPWGVHFTHWGLQRVTESPDTIQNTRRR